MKTIHWFLINLGITVFFGFVYAYIIFWSPSSLHMFENQYGSGFYSGSFYTFYSQEWTSKTQDQKIVKVKYRLSFEKESDSLFEPGGDTNLEQQIPAQIQSLIDQKVSRTKSISDRYDIFLGNSTITQDSTTILSGLGLKTSRVFVKILVNPD